MWLWGNGFAVEFYCVVECFINFQMRVSRRVGVIDTASSSEISTLKEMGVGLWLFVDFDVR